MTLRGIFVDRKTGKSDRLPQIVGEKSRYARSHRICGTWNITNPTTVKRLIAIRLSWFVTYRCVGGLLYENRLGEQDMRGLREGKMKSIRSFAQFLRDGAA